MKIDDIIKSRKTRKVLANEPWETSGNKEALETTIQELLALASSAPYHYKANKRFQSEDKELNSCLPFRCYVLKDATCRVLVKYADEKGLELKKLKNMLNAADVLFLVTWLPDREYETEFHTNKELLPFEGSLINMEHIAAAATAIQNILIGASARNIPNYWSSGGALKENVLRDYLEISMEEILLGAIFLFPKDIAKRDALVKLGGLRNLGKEVSTWSKIIDKR